MHTERRGRQSYLRKSSTGSGLMRTRSLTINWNSKYLIPIYYRSYLLMLYSPVSPAAMDWSAYYPAFVVPHEPDSEGTATTTPAQENAIRQLAKDVEVADIGCGFGGLLVALAPMLPDKLLLGTAIPSYYQISS